MALPPAVRNRLAELAVEGLDDGGARAVLAAVAALGPDGAGRPGPADRDRLLGLGWFRLEEGGTVRVRGAHRAHWPAIRARARAALAAAGEPEAGPGGPPGGIAGALRRAARLADQGLHFEVHELLEPLWLRAEGPVRVALQGLIQVAAALHHLEESRAGGTRSLLAEGLAKVAAAEGALPLETRAWRTGLAAVLAAVVAERAVPAPPPWPRPVAARAATGRPG